MALLDALVAEPVPVQPDEDGALRVGGTRVRLDTVIEAFHNGCAAEEILLKYPSLKLADIYAVITYYLWHRAEVDAYLDQRRRLAEKVRQDNESRYPPQGVRERLLVAGLRGPRTDPAGVILYIHNVGNGCQHRQRCELLPPFLRLCPKSPTS